ncbi:MAG: hypothetical protein J6M53_05575 [Bacteroidaceae bacterium]|nr:hypothetical protein [Bacteroidaceae bacterium]
MKNNDEIIRWDEVPGNYPLCFATSCPKSADCLHALATAALPDSVRIVTAFNPRACDGEKCYRTAQPVQIAYGFTEALSKVPLGDVWKVRDYISRHFSLRQYYHYRSGAKPLTPEKQRIVSDAFLAAGLSLPIVFDRYAAEYAW